MSKLLIVVDTQEGKNLPVPHCIKGSAGWELVPELLPFAEGRMVMERCF